MIKEEIKELDDDDFLEFIKAEIKRRNSGLDNFSSEGSSLNDCTLMALDLMLNVLSY